MGDIPLRYESGRTLYLKDVATPRDAAYIQTNVVRISTMSETTHKMTSKREVYIPVYRQLGASTLKVVSSLGSKLKEFSERLSRPGINLKLVMDQSVYVKSSIMALVQEGVLGAILCSLVILLFLGQIRMTAIAIMTLPISIMASSAALYFCRADDQRDDSGRDDAGDRADDRQRHHLPGEYPPASGPRRDAA